MMIFCLNIIFVKCATPVINGKKHNIKLFQIATAFNFMQNIDIKLSKYVQNSRLGVSAL